jgi:hypothetical protein
MIGARGPYNLSGSATTGPKEVNKTSFMIFEVLNK